MATKSANVVARVEQDVKEQAEEIMKEIILQTNASAAQELGRGILERVLTYSGYCATDDMTVLAAGLWRN